MRVGVRRRSPALRVRLVTSERSRSICLMPGWRPNERRVRTGYRCERRSPRHCVKVWRVSDGCFIRARRRSGRLGRKRCEKPKRGTARCRSGADLKRSGAFGVRRRGSRMRAGVVLGVARATRGYRSTFDDGNEALQSRLVRRDPKVARVQKKGRNGPGRLPTGTAWMFSTIRASRQWHSFLANRARSAHGGADRAIARLGAVARAKHQRLAKRHSWGGVPGRST